MYTPRKTALTRWAVAPALGWLLGLWAWEGGAPSARADHIDQALQKQSLKILQVLRKEGYANVGVLKFQVTMPNKKARYDVGVINGNMARRLENALILANSETKPIGIIRNAGQVAARAAAKKRGVSPITAAGRASLFEGTYPLAWGETAVAADAFLTGVVQVAPDLSKTTVLVQIFNKDDKDLRKVARFTVPTDRSILTDLGQGFALTKRDLGGVSDTEQDLAAIKNSFALSKKESTASAQEKVELKIFYDKEPIASGSDPDNGGLKVREPKDGQAVHLTLRNKTDKRIAVALRVNGQNTTVADEQGLEINEYTKWILDPDKEYTIKGFYHRDGKGYDAFKVLSDDESKQIALKPEIKGLIQIDVFEDGGTQDTELLATDARAISLRGGGRMKGGAGKPVALTVPKTLREAKLQLVRGTRIRANTMGLLTGGEKGAADVKTVTFRNPTHAGTLTLRYYPKVDSTSGE